MTTQPGTKKRIGQTRTTAVSGKTNLNQRHGHVLRDDGITYHGVRN